MDLTSYWRMCVVSSIDINKTSSSHSKIDITNIKTTLSKHWSLLICNLYTKHSSSPLVYFISELWDLFINTKARPPGQRKTRDVITGMVQSLSLHSLPLSAKGPPSRELRNRLTLLLSLKRARFARSWDFCIF